VAPLTHSHADHVETTTPTGAGNHIGAGLTNGRQIVYALHGPEHHHVDEDDRGHSHGWSIRDLRSHAGVKAITLSLLIGTVAER
jgi:hypothetical protein